MFAEIDKNYLNPSAPCPLAMVVCNIGEAESQSAQNRPDGFPLHHVLWVDAGEALFRAGRENRVLTQGMGLFCRRGVPHKYERIGPRFSTRWITFLGGEGALDYYGAPDYFFFSANPAMVSAVSELERQCRGSSTILSRSAAGYSWLTEWLASVFGASPSPALVVRQYLEAHFAEPLTLEEIAAQVHMDRFTLCRYYRENEGTTVMDQLKHIRIAKAKQYLRYAEGSIEEIGRMCGYENHSYFGKIFREETGSSPREYREMHRMRV